MATRQPEIMKLVYLDEIILQDVPKLGCILRLFVGDDKRKLQTKDARIWTPTERVEVSPATKIGVEIQMRSYHLPWAKKEQIIKEIDLVTLFNMYWTSKAHELVVPEVVVIGRHTFSLQMRFSTNSAAESLRWSLKELEALLEKYSPMTDAPTERVVTVIKYGAAFSELNPVAKAAFGLAHVTFEILKQRNKYDQIPSVLLDRLKHILVFADKTVDEIVGEETEILEKIIPRMFKVVQMVAIFSCDYVKRVGKVGESVYSEAIEEMDRNLTEVIEDFDRAINVENLWLVKKTEQQFLFERLEPVKTGYNLYHRCMEGTRKSILNQIMAWVDDPQERNGGPQSNIYWIYGSPGIGKTALAHSICAILDDREQLAGAFFCRRDDPNLSKHQNILPTLITKLAGAFPPFRNIVADRLRNDPNLNPESMKGSLLLDCIRSLPRQPAHTLVVTIDALDECGDHQSRPALLNVLTGVAAYAPWLKVIITSRAEVDIQRFFNALSPSSYSSYDLATDQEASTDLRTFARCEFELVARSWYLSTPWPEEPLFNRVISRANGLFIFIKTIVLALEYYADPTESLEATLHDSACAGLKPLYGLYSNILKARIPPGNAEFRQMIGVVLTTAPYRPMCDTTVAGLAGVRRNLVKKWVDDLSPFLCRDETAYGGIRVRHLSISDFFVSDHCAYQVNARDANVQLGISCITTMIKQLRFNICKLEDSRLPNEDVKDLPSRIEENISDALQYSSLYWSNHLCFSVDTGDLRVWTHLGEFFGGLYGLFWIEVLSLMGMVPIGAPTLRRLLSWAKDGDPAILRRIQDTHRFIITFHIPLSISTPHTYLSTGPFLPSESPLSTIFSIWFTKAIKMKRGKLLTWPTPPLQWIGHAQPVISICCSPNGYHIATGSSDMTIRIWDVETGAAISNPLKGHTGKVYSVAYSPDGRRIISGSTDRSIRIWDAGTGATVGKPLEGHAGAVYTVAYSPNGWHLISGSSDRTIRIWDAETGAAIGPPLEGHSGSVRCIAYSPNGLHIISGSSDRTIRIWDAKTSAAIGTPLEGHTDGVLSVVCTPDGRHVISGSSDSTIRIWDAKTGTTVGNPLKGHIGPVWSIAYSPNRQHIVSGSSDKTIRIWNAETGAAIGQPLEGHNYFVHSVAYSLDGQHIISGGSDSAIRIWDARTGATVGSLVDGHTRPVHSVVYSPDGYHIVSGSADNTIQIWDAETGAAVGRPLEGHTGVVRSVACSPNGRHIISGSWDATIRIWSTEAGGAVGGPLEGHIGEVESVAYSPNGKRIISGSQDGTIWIWDADTGAALGPPLEGHSGVVLSVAYSPDGRHIISGSFDHIRIWDAETGAPVSEPIAGHTGVVWSVAYSPDGRRIISGSDDKTIRIWDAETGVAIGKPLEGHTNRISSVVYSPNGQYIISSSADSTIRIWDAETGDAVGDPLKAHNKNVRSIACSPDGRYLVSGSWDTTIHVWDIYHPVQPPSLSNPIYSCFVAQPDKNGWVRDSENGLLYWVPPDCRTGLHSPALLTIPPTAPTRSVSLVFDDFVFGTSWTQIFNYASL